jgi:hypothetical protein
MLVLKAAPEPIITLMTIDAHILLLPFIPLDKFMGIYIYIHILSTQWDIYIYWLVVWNIWIIFPYIYIGNNHPH